MTAEQEEALERFGDEVGLGRQADPLGHLRREHAGLPGAAHLFQHRSGVRQELVGMLGGTERAQLERVDSLGVLERFLATERAESAELDVAGELVLEPPPSAHPGRQEIAPAHEGGQQERRRGAPHPRPS